jgi:hypothetical protein
MVPGQMALTTPRGEDVATRAEVMALRSPSGLICTAGRMRESNQGCHRFDRGGPNTSSADRLAGAAIRL